MGAKAVGHNVQVAAVGVAACELRRVVGSLCGSGLDVILMVTSHAVPGYAVSLLGFSVAGMRFEYAQVGTVEVAVCDGSHLDLMPLGGRISRGPGWAGMCVCGDEAGAEGEAQARSDAHCCSRGLDSL